VSWLPPFCDEERSILGDHGIVVLPIGLIRANGSRADGGIIGLAVDGLGPSVLSLLPRHQTHCTWRYKVVKGGGDRVFASLLVGVFALPCMLVAAAISLESGGSVFYREERVGRGGGNFRIWKFRTMRQPNEPTAMSSSKVGYNSALQRRINKDPYDDRVTAIGRFLRRWSLDELPQLINVVRGEMSLVGPRPVVREELSLYGEGQDFYLAVTPGMSGLWQVSGRSNLSFETRVKLDQTYVRSWSLRNDLTILLRTLPAVLRRVGAR
jgi:exopolysaccharide production protein ExoY